MKLCSDCKISKPLPSFYNLRRLRKDGTEYITQMGNCKSCENIRRVKRAAKAPKKCRRCKTKREQSLYGSYMRKGPDGEIRPCTRLICNPCLDAEKQLKQAAAATEAMLNEPPTCRKKRVKGGIPCGDFTPMVYGVAL